MVLAMGITAVEALLTKTKIIVSKNPFVNHFSAKKSLRRHLGYTNHK